MEQKQRGEQKCILLVDDDFSVRTLYSRFLNKEGYLVTAVKNGYQGIEALEKHHFDLALVDVAMAGMNGIEVLENIRRRRPEVAVVIYTAYGSPEIAGEAIEKGAADYLDKPFSLKELKATVKRILGDNIP